MDLPSFSPPVITLTYASVLGLVFLLMSINVVRHRARAKVDIGYGEDKDLGGVFRAHANFAEYVPLILVILALTEGAGGDDLLLRILGGGLVVARLLHVWGLSSSTGVTPGRFIGTILTWAVLLVASGMGLYIALG